MSNKRTCYKGSVSTVSYKRSLIIGMILGKAFSRVIRSGKRLRAEMIVSHSIGEADLVRWKAQEISRYFGGNIAPKEDRNRQRVWFSVTRGRRIRVIHKWFHRDGKKAVTDKIRFMDHPVGLAMLICDNGLVKQRKKRHKDGTVYYSAPYMSLRMRDSCSQSGTGFSEDDIENLLIHIKHCFEVQGHVKIREQIRSGKYIRYGRIKFDIINSIALWRCINPWIPDIPSVSERFALMKERYGTSSSDQKAGA